MKGNLLRGVAYLPAGIRLIIQPGIRPFVLIPLLINIVLFAVMIYFAYRQTNDWVAWLMAWLPNWLGFLDWLLWLVFGLVILALLVFTFSFVANLIASPFNGLLSAAVEKYLTGSAVPESGRSLMQDVLHAIGRELNKAGYYLPRVLFLFILTMIPPITLAGPLIWFLFGAWMLAIQYLDYPMDNHSIGFRQMKAELKAQRLTSLGFGGITLAAMMVPVVNFVVMPAAVAGATALYLDQQNQQDE